MDSSQWKREIIDAMLFLVFEYDRHFINTTEYRYQMNQLLLLYYSQR